MRSFYDSPEKIFNEVSEGFYKRYGVYPQGHALYQYVKCGIERQAQAFKFYTYLQELQEGFLSDGCSSSLDYDIYGICVFHDFLYFLYHIYSHDEAWRKQADEWLKGAITTYGKSKPGHTRIRYTWLAWSRYWAVRLFGKGHVSLDPNK